MNDLPASTVHTWLKKERGTDSKTAHTNSFSKELRRAKLEMQDLELEN